MRHGRRMGPGCTGRRAVSQVPLKTQVIPQQRLEAWEAAVVRSLVGPSVVSQGGRYLGVWILERCAKASVRSGLR
eukprot:11008765-Lingulodinium_polyedra.AAC.1